ncbi:MAG: hypothetical protein N4A65_03035 [Cohaesibacter sp.]|jgi:hypothetical protein|nr:hypothetical protein [Cohaesibacter sp.]
MDAVISFLKAMDFTDGFGLIATIGAVIGLVFKGMKGWVSYLDTYYRDILACPDLRAIRRDELIQKPGFLSYQISLRRLNLILSRIYGKSFSAGALWISIVIAFCYTILFFTASYFVGGPIDNVIFPLGSDLEEKIIIFLIIILCFSLFLFLVKLCYENIFTKSIRYFEFKGEKKSIDISYVVLFSFLLTSLVKFFVENRYYENIFYGYTLFST